MDPLTMFFSAFGAAVGLGTLIGVILLILIGVGIL